MAKFKVGDKVRVIPNALCKWGRTQTMVDLWGKEVTIIKIYSDYFYIAEDNGLEMWDYNQIELISGLPEKPMANKITNIARGLLDEDYKKLIKVGWLNSDLSLTDVGRDTVLSRYLMKNKEAFGEMAGELLDEQKEDCK